MKQAINKAISWMLSSFDVNTNGGASARKLSAFWATTMLATPPHYMWMKWAYNHNDFSLLPAIIALDFGFASAALGMTVYQAIKDKKMNNDTSNENQQINN